MDREQAEGRSHGQRERRQSGSHRQGSESGTSEKRSAKTHLGGGGQQRVELGGDSGVAAAELGSGGGIVSIGGVCSSDGGVVLESVGLAEGGRVVLEIGHG